MPRVLEKKERRLGVKLSIKGERSLSPKAAITRRPYAPGVHGKRMRRKVSEFGTQLAEKQKIKFTYGLNEKQLKALFKEAGKKPGVIAQNVLEVLESRLDNAVFRLGYAESRSIARQVVGHGHFMVNGKKVRTKSYRLKKGDKISVRPESQNHPLFKDLKEKMKNYTVPVWLSVNPETLEAVFESHPRDIEMPFDINVVVDYYSR